MTRHYFTKSTYFMIVRKCIYTFHLRWLFTHYAHMLISINNLYEHIFNKMDFDAKNAHNFQSQRSFTGCSNTRPVNKIGWNLEQRVITSHQVRRSSLSLFIFIVRDFRLSDLQLVCNRSSELCLIQVSITHTFSPYPFGSHFSRSNPRWMDWAMEDSIRST